MRRNAPNLAIKLFATLSCVLASATFAAQPSASASLKPVRTAACSAEKANCQEFDAIVFVHGIYGDSSTFLNTKTGFDWPETFPTDIAPSILALPRKVDVFRLTYQTSLLSWAKGNSPDFEDVAKDIFAAMKPLRQRQYRSIGFITHSLGGNIISTYVFSVKTSRGHVARSQNAFVITLANPVLGAQIADIGLTLKTLLGMNDDLLNSLQQGNLYLRMLRQFRIWESEKGEERGCRQVHLHAAYEQKHLGPLLVVGPDSAAAAISGLVHSPIVGFALDHSEIAKPDSTQHVVYKWVMARVQDEYQRLYEWELSRATAPAEKKVCERNDFIPEK